ncbi:pyrroline-5-carboxylate reductase 3-like isoform X2 [Dysidea avara]|uniref:pyrroline-5-carboxylate reductase 3-like isoform X2 n=1 Tax=Dysidea avara TaxID=196820 RepID=UPI00332EB237
MEGTKIGFVGAGNMAQAVVKGLLSSGKPFNISASATKETSESYQKMKSLGVSMHVNNVEICQSHVVVIAVKPYLVAKVMGEIKDHLTSDHVIVSLAAGVSVADLSQCAPSDVGVVRTSITTTVCVQSGVVVMVASPNVSDEHKKLLTDIFSVLGHFEMTDKEEYVKINTTFPGSGVAYMCMLLEAYSDGGVLIGLPRAKAIQIAAMTMMGTAKMVLETGKHPGELKDAVCSPKGLSILGVQSLERSGFRSSIIDAIDVANKGT